MSQKRPPRIVNLRDCESVAGTEKCEVFTSSLDHCPLTHWSYVNRNCQIGVHAQASGGYDTCPSAHSW